MKIRDVLYYVLEDDDTEFGGTSFSGERVIDFIEYTDLSIDDDIDDLNEALKDCGIKPIDETKISLLDHINSLLTNYYAWRAELRSDLDMFDDGYCEEEKGEMNALNRVIRDLVRLTQKELDKNE